MPAACIRACLAGAGLLLVSCGSTADVRVAPEPVADPSAPLSPEQNKALAAAERLYREGSDTFPARRDELAREPGTARWLTRMLARDAAIAFDRRQASDDEFFKQVVGLDPLWDRALLHLRALGGAAAPGLIDDLLRHVRHDRRRLGVTLLGVTGPSSLPAMESVLASPDNALRRLAVLAVGEMEPAPATVAALRRAAADREFSVRAAACEGLGLATRAEPSVAADLRAALANEPDPFVRRVIARALGGDRSKATALALVAFLRQSLDTGDRQATTAAHEALARLADHDPRRGRAYEAWAQWAAERPERWEDRHGTVEDHSR